MSDSEGEKQVKARPQSMIAQNFSLALDDAFGLDGTFELSQTVEDKKMVVNTQSAELQALEARLRATEERLKAKTGGKVPAAAISGKTAQQIRAASNGEQSKQVLTNNSRPNTAGRPPTATRPEPPQAARKPVPAQEDSDDDDEDTEEEEDSDETEESSEEEVPRRRK